MIPFPIVRSHLSVAALADLITVEYGLTAVHVQLIKAMLSDTYHVTSQEGLFILRIYRQGQRTTAQIEAELAFLDYLQAGELRVATAVATTHNRHILTLLAPEGTRYAVLFHHLPGQTLSHQLTAQHSYQYGQTVAQLHHLADEYREETGRPAIDTAWLLDAPLTSLPLAFPIYQTHWQELHPIADTVRRYLNQLPTDGLIHGDIDASNVLALPDGQMALLDFDYFGPGWRGYDLGTFLAASHFHGDAALHDAFIQGYGTIRPLSSQILHSLPYFAIARIIWTLGLYADNVNEWGSYRLPYAFLQHNLKIIQALATNLPKD